MGGMSQTRDCIIAHLPGQVLFCEPRFIQITNDTAPHLAPDAVYRSSLSITVSIIRHLPSQKTSLQSTRYKNAIHPQEEPTRKPMGHTSGLYSEPGNMAFAIGHTDHPYSIGPATRDHSFASSNSISCPHHHQDTSEGLAVAYIKDSCEKNGQRIRRDRATRTARC